MIARDHLIVTVRQRPGDPEADPRPGGSTHLEATIEAGDGWISVNGDKFQVLSQKDPGALPWKDLGVDLVCEMSGHPDEKPFSIDGCHALKSSGPQVATFFPRWFRAEPEGAQAAATDA